MEDLNFKNISDKQINRILFTIKARFQKYWIVWISRLEWIKFWLSERQMLNLINHLRIYWYLKFKWMVKCNNNKYKCNTYSVTDMFMTILEKLKWITNKIIKHIDTIEYIKNNFVFKKKYWKIIFELKWVKYIVSLRGRFKNKIYDSFNNKIVSIYSLMRW